MSSLDLLLRQINGPSELSWKDETYDLALASDLRGTERDAFMSRLVDAAHQDDRRAVLMLGYLGASEALPALARLAKTNHPMAAIARRALAAGSGRSCAWASVAQSATTPPELRERLAESIATLR